jgi:hypothetical protein
MPDELNFTWLFTQKRPHTYTEDHSKTFNAPHVCWFQIALKDGVELTAKRI